MNYKNNSNENEIERRLVEIEGELERKHQTILASTQLQSKESANGLTKLGRGGKAVVFFAVVLGGIWVMTTVVSFVSMMLGFVIVGGVVYAAWKLLYAR